MKAITLLCLCVIVIAAGAGAGIYHNTTEEQVSIQEEEMEVIGRYDQGSFLIVWKIHDNKDNVTCWATDIEGISCIPDHMLTP